MRSSTHWPDRGRSRFTLWQDIEYFSGADWVHTVGPGRKRTEKSGGFDSALTLGRAKTLLKSIHRISTVPVEHDRTLSAECRRPLKKLIPAKLFAYGDTPAAIGLGYAAKGDDEAPLIFRLQRLHLQSDRERRAIWVPWRGAQRAAMGFDNCAAN